MLRIYTGNTYKSISTLDVDYFLPERDMSPWEQLEWFDMHLKQFQTEDVSITTFSPYILNYLNLKLIKGELTKDMIQVIERFYDEETNEIYDNDLVIVNADLVDATSLSEPISYIYDEYNKIKEKQLRQVKPIIEK
jgi:hypothetical protein